MKLFNDDCINILKSLDNDSIDSLVTDPPAGIGFMGKEWDHHKGGRQEWVKWMGEVMRECYRVMKPGAHGLVWAIPRTSHWTATALEDAGFEVRDVITHIFGQGFPKSLNVSKAIDKAAGAKRPVIGSLRCKQMVGGEYRKDGNPQIQAPVTTSATDAAKQWDGWGTALKPASEHWILVRKPLSEKTVAANVLKWGTGGINIDGCRIEAKDADKLEKNCTHRKAPAGFSEKEGTCYGIGQTQDFSYRQQQGRFPANLVLSHSPLCEEDQCDLECAVKMLDMQSGNLKTGGCPRKTHASGGIYGAGKNIPDGPTFKVDSGGASRFFYCAKISSSERNVGLELGEAKVRSDARPGSPDQTGEFPDHDGRVRAGNNHPTVKTKKLMSYLCKLVTPPNGVVLDPFMGSGSTGIAAKECGFGFIGIEKEPDYFEIAQKRIEHCYQD